MLLPLVSALLVSVLCRNVTIYTGGFCPNSDWFPQNACAYSSQDLGATWQRAGPPMSPELSKTVTFGGVQRTARGLVFFGGGTSQNTYGNYGVFSAYDDTKNAWATATVDFNIADMCVLDTAGKELLIAGGRSLDPEHPGYMTGGAIARSSDGGLTWTESTILSRAGPIFMLGCMDPANIFAYMTGGGPGQLYGGQMTAVASSTDGGNTFTLMQLVGVNPNMAGGNCFSGNEYNPGSPLSVYCLYHNGDYHFTQTPLNFTKATLSDMVFTPSLSQGVVSVLNFTDGPPLIRQLLYSTSDRGQTWDRVGKNVDFGTVSSIQASYLDVSDDGQVMVAFGSNNGVGGKGLRTWVSLDGGETWNITSSRMPSMFQGLSVAVVSEDE